MQAPDLATPSRDQLLKELERLQRELPPEQYGAASARIIYQLKQLDAKRQRYALS